MKKVNAALAASVVRVPKTRGKSKNKNHKPEVEQLRDEVRTLKSTVRHLKKQLSKANKDSHRLEDLEEMVQEETVNELLDKCSQCEKGTMIMVELGPKLMLKCNICTNWSLIK